MKAKQRQFALLTLSLVMAFPSFAGRMLCADCCGSPRMVRENAGCPCCHPAPERELPSCCQNRTETDEPSDDTDQLGQLKNHRPCACVDVAQDAYPITIAKNTDHSKWALPHFSVALSIIDLFPKSSGALPQPPDHPPSGNRLLSTVILLI